MGTDWEGILGASGEDLQDAMDDAMQRAEDLQDFWGGAMQRAEDRGAKARNYPRNYPRPRVNPIFETIVPDSGYILRHRSENMREEWVEWEDNFEIEAIFEGKLVKFPHVYRGHQFSHNEILKLLKKETVGIGETNFAGEEYTSNISLDFSESTTGKEMLVFVECSASPSVELRDEGRALFYTEFSRLVKEDIIGRYSSTDDNPFGEGLKRGLDSFSPAEQIYETFVSPSPRGVWEAWNPEGAIDPPRDGDSYDHENGSLSISENNLKNLVQELVNYLEEKWWDDHKFFESVGLDLFDMMGEIYVSIPRNWEELLFPQKREPWKLSDDEPPF